MTAPFFEPLIHTRLNDFEEKSMKKQMLSAALVALLAVPALAQNLAVVNGKPVPSSRVNALKQQVEASGRPVTPEVLAQIKEELIAREVFMQEAKTNTTSSLQPMAARNTAHATSWWKKKTKPKP